jgi:hypothetical protein
MRDAADPTLLVGLEFEKAPHSADDVREVIRELQWMLDNGHFPEKKEAA